MARTLPENTVDAWTAISLAHQGASWIWLPTRNQGATSGGTHPGDLSGLVGRRLLIIENKGIENSTTIAFGPDGRAQRNHLQAVEEAGLRALQQFRGVPIPPLGWVLYGLPLLPAPVSGSSWEDFPAFHHLVCPHDLDQAGVGDTSSTIANLGGCVLADKITDHRADPFHAAGRIIQPLVLDRLRDAADRGLVGLPLQGNGAGGWLTLSYVLSEMERTLDLPSVDGDRDPSTHDILARLSMIARRGASHLVLAVL